MYFLRQSPVLPRISWMSFWAVIFSLNLSEVELVAQGYPGYAVEPTITEYDVDLTWPSRPEYVAKFGWVSGMALDSQERVWLFNKGDDPIQCYRTSGEFEIAFGQGEFDQPHQIRIDHEDYVWVADFGLHVVRKYSTQGVLLQELGVRGEAGEDETHFNKPTDIAITPAGDIFVTDGYGNRRVVHLDKNGKFIKAWGSYGTKPGQFVLPHAIALDQEGNLFVADRNSARVMKFSQSGELLDQWSNLIMPWGLSVNRENEVWVCGSSPHWWLREQPNRRKYLEVKDQVFMRFSTEGRLNQLWSIPMGDYDNPKKTAKGGAVGVHCIVQDHSGNLYVGDIYSEQAQKFVPVTKRAAK